MMRPSSGGSDESKDAAGHSSHFGDAHTMPGLPSMSPFPSDPEQLREELRVLRQREREIMVLLGSASTQRIMHDIRNLLNEVQLLRYLADKND
jgi:hypothetical protein